MTYKKAESTRFVLTVVVVLIYCIMIFFLFRQFAYNKNVSKETYNAIEVIFGCRRDNPAGSGSLQALGFSFMNLLPHLFIISAIVLSIVKVVVPKLFNKYVDLTTTILLFLAAILLLFTHKFANFQGEGGKYRFIADKNYFHLGWAAIVYSITTFVCAGFMTYCTVLAFKQDHLEDTDAIEEENEKQEKMFRSKSMAELKAELMKELGKDKNTDITKDADLQQATDSDLKINTINESKEDTIDIKLEDNGQE
ncbi:MAG: hypothetical protein K6E20_03860 [Acholeplasmatales bacterium]|nr:hypothetical protein [Acholeplasmatales bacterium]